MRYTLVMAKKHWGFDTSAMDRSVRPADDFYRYANGNWIKKHTIPPAESRWGSFNILRHTTEKQLRVLMRELEKSRAGAGSDAQLVRDYYRAAADMNERNKRGTAPLMKYRRIIDAIKDETGLLTGIAELNRRGVDVPWAAAIDQDSKNSARYVLHLYQSGLGMPDRDYYLRDDAEFLRVRKAYLAFAEKLLTLSGLKLKSAKDAIAVVMNIETALAKASMDKVDLRDAEKTYHKKSLADLTKLAPNIDWRQYFKVAKIPTVPYLIVMQPEFLKESSRLLSDFSVDDWKTYLFWHVLLDATPLLSQKFVRANFEFYGRVLAGQKAMRPLWRRALAATNSAVGFALGKVYVSRYFPENAKRTMDELVSDLFTVYERRMHGLDWMSPETRKKAVHKLRAVQRKIGYPTKWKKYPGLTVDPRDYFGNAERVQALEYRRAMAKLKKPIDRSEWFMTPQTVNAYCSFNMNEIVFPAAILQHPFFDLRNDAAVNYGAIGSVIGHEMTHAFDDQGSKFDEKGNLKSWWTAEDRKKFEARAKILVRQYNEFRVADGVAVNGQLTLGENIADLGGLVIAYDALQAHLKKTGKRDVIDGFTPEQRFFLGFAQQEQELARPEFQKLAAINDPHSPAEFRINGPVSHLPEFYDAFGVKPGDPMYRKLADRARIW